MLERVLSSRRATPVSDDGDETGDESKTRKHLSVATRVTNYVIRTGHLWPCLLLGLVIVVATSFVYHTRDLVCISASSSDHHSRLRFFGFEGLETDFGSLGVPWCKFLALQFQCLFRSVLFFLVEDCVGLYFL